jgi:serine/threonine protein kinase/class 3 adenylate cyclase
VHSMGMTDNPAQIDQSAFGRIPSRLEALVFTDIVDSSGIKSRCGAPAYAKNLQIHNSLFEVAIASYPGATLVKHTGDGFFARFPTASEAVRCMLRFGRSLSKQTWEGESLPVRVGIHIGEVAIVRMADRTDVIGSPADATNRIMSLGVGGQILLSSIAADEARRFISHELVRWTRHGLYKLKGIENPVEIWEVAEPTTAVLPAPAGAMMVDDPVAHIPAGAPERIGPYRLVERLGEGGMGTVYKAQQLNPVKRTVAIKLIKAGFDSAEVIARFESERQALARMDHPNIAKVLDAGSDDHGRPYFVLEYVPGTPITKYADDNKLSIRERLELVLQVCDAVAHAHSKAIIHRDIKASNVLAYTSDGVPRVKVIDFGIAKALTSDRLTDRTFNTEHGQAVGTYETMSPEQADGSPDIDTRTDVYSLGVLLYELLSGTKPFDRTDLAKAADAEVRRIIREVDPPRPSTQLSSMGEAGSTIAKARQVQLDALARQLSSELDWIPLMAMRKQRERRYGTPQQMAEDIRSYLDGKPLVAAPDSLGYRIGKLARRNKGPIFAVASVFIVLVLGVTGTSIALIKEARAEHQAQEQRKQAELSANNAKRELLLTAELVAAIDSYAPNSPTAFDALDHVLAAIRKGDLPESTRARLIEQIGRIYDNLGDSKKGISTLTYSLLLIRALPNPNEGLLADNLNHLAWAYLHNGEPASGEAPATEAYLTILNLEGPQSDNTFAYQADMSRMYDASGGVATKFGEQLFLRLMLNYSGTTQPSQQQVDGLRKNISDLLDKVEHAEASGQQSAAFELIQGFIQPYLDGRTPRIRQRMPWALMQFAEKVRDQYGRPYAALATARFAEKLAGEILPTGHPDIALVDQHLRKLEESLKLNPQAAK